MKRKAGNEDRHAVNAGQEAFGLKHDDEPRTLTIVSTDLEHNSVLRPLYRLQDECGAELRFAGVDRTGRLRYEELEALCTPEVDLVVCTHTSNLTGALVDIRRVARAAHRCGAVLIVDAAQTAGAYPIDMEDMGIDIHRAQKSARTAGNGRLVCVARNRCSAARDGRDRCFFL